MPSSTLFRLGYVAMSVHLENSSPSQTMTYKRYNQLDDPAAARRRLEHIAQSNINNCLRLLKHNWAHDIHFFRLSSRLVPLATHEALADWDYMSAIQEPLQSLGAYAKEHQMRLDFHPDHFVVLNTPKKETLKASINILRYHRRLLMGMNLDSRHRCVLHVGGTYKDKPKALERFVTNWAYIPKDIQQMLMIENDDKSFTLLDGLYLSEKLGVPLVFDYHHHLANHDDPDWESHWPRIVDTWANSPLPLKMHISSPKSDQAFRSHADTVDADRFMHFVKAVNGSVPQIDCMIEAKKKDGALFQLITDLKKREDVEIVDGSSFYILS
ncbi:UV DNA damage repair endonuclease UvsE [Tuberibacillus sp. Marseille-P3662]|uniref:UV DNA damage repair endonuclease UvsE n=1 Tax=Tuberibacillus sp. Marseille-P3662 TaxID=1965358 RepID=UPI000A1CB7EC|nr:UV DNA damage repair endonuclease UvsE [Tuberibacillus sp. Marseille-P3662]